MLTNILLNLLKKQLKQYLIKHKCVKILKDILLYYNISALVAKLAKALDF